MDSLILLHFVAYRTQTLIKEMQSIPRLDKSNIYLILESISWLIHVKELNQCRKSLTCCATGTTRHKNWAEQQMKRLFLSIAGFLTRIQTVTSWSRCSSAVEQYSLQEHLSQSLIPTTIIQEAAWPNTLWACLAPMKATLNNNSRNLSQKHHCSHSFPDPDPKHLISKVICTCFKLNISPL